MAKSALVLKTKMDMQVHSTVQRSCTFKEGSNALVVSATNHVYVAHYGVQSTARFDAYTPAMTADVVTPALCSPGRVWSMLFIPVQRLRTGPCLLAVTLHEVLKLLLRLSNITVQTAVLHVNSRPIHCYNGLCKIDHLQLLDAKALHGYQLCFASNISRAVQAIVQHALV